ncbi:hypothetical protein TSMEX_009130 [Taenia solium]|eukprot:TsM_000565300 transcript=TsM_000565300 gene=TsM_000565300
MMKPTANLTIHSSKDSIVANSFWTVFNPIVVSCFYYGVCNGLALSSCTYGLHRLPSEKFESEANAVSEHEDNEGT